MQKKITKNLRNLRERYVNEIVLDRDCLEGIINSPIFTYKGEECELILLVLDEGLPQRMIAGEKNIAVMREWARMIADKYGFMEGDALDAIRSWRNMLRHDAPNEEEAKFNRMFGIKNGNLKLCYIPESLRDYDTCLASIEHDPWTVDHIPQDLPRYNDLSLEAERLKDIYMSNISRKGDNLQYIASDARNRELCLAAVRQNGKSIRFVPRNLRDMEICLEALRHWDFSSLRDKSRFLSYVPWQLRSRELCQAVLARDVSAKPHVPGGVTSLR